MSKLFVHLLSSHKGTKGTKRIFDFRFEIENLYAPEGKSCEVLSILSKAIEDDFALVKGSRAVTKAERVTVRARPGWKLQRSSGCPSHGERTMSVSLQLPSEHEERP